MFQKFSEEAKKIIKKSKLEMQELKHPFIGTEHFILSCLKCKDLEITKLLNTYNISYDNYKKELIKMIGIGCSLNSYFIYTPMFKRILENTIIDVKEDNIEEVNVNHIFLSLLDEGEGVGIRILSNLGVDLDEIYKELENNNKIIKGKTKKKLSISVHSVDLIEKASAGKIDPVIGRDKEINRLIEILLRKTKNNPLLIGEAGVGKTAIVEGLALKILKNDVPDSLKDKKILSVSMASLVAGTKYRGEFEERIEKIVKEIENNSNLILFIDEMHSIVGAGGAEGAIDAANILKPALARGKFRLIGATTIKEYKDTIEKDKALNRRFQTILVEETKELETKNILMKLKPLYEKYHGVIIKDKIIDLIIYLSNKYIYSRKNPDKSIDILDEVCARRSLIKDKSTLKQEELDMKLNLIIKEKNNNIIKQDFKEASRLKEEEIKIQDEINNLLLNKKNIKKEVTEEDVSNVIESKINMPIYEINKEHIKNLNKVEINLNKIIIGQKDAINVLTKETKKIKLGLKKDNKPTSFLFIGKSGVGKTLLAKEYSKLLKMHLIRIDASEYKESHAISKIIGSPPGYVGYEEYTILDEIKNYPYSVILIDEIDKSCKEFVNLFLQILDEGFITNSNFDKIYFNNCIIIMTSNNYSNNSLIGFENNSDNKEQLKNLFSLEFINRIKNIIYFKDLEIEDIKKIINIKIKEVIENLKKQQINIIIEKNIINEIINMSNYKETGARQINKLIEDKIDDVIINNLLKENKKTIYIN